MKIIIAEQINNSVFRTPDEKLRWSFKMYDEDNSREIDIHEMESVMLVRQSESHCSVSVLKCTALNVSV